MSWAGRVYSTSFDVRRETVCSVYGQSHKTATPNPYLTLTKPGEEISCPHRHLNPDWFTGRRRYSGDFHGKLRRRVTSAKINTGYYSRDQDRDFRWGSQRVKVLSIDIYSNTLACNSLVFRYVKPVFYNLLCVWRFVQTSFDAVWATSLRLVDRYEWKSDLQAVNNWLASDERNVTQMNYILHIQWQNPKQYLGLIPLWCDIQASFEQVFQCLIEVQEPH